MVDIYWLIYIVYINKLKQKHEKIIVISYRNCSNNKQL